MAQSIRHRLAIHFTRFGPYHKARLASASRALSSMGWQVNGLETASMDAVYQWQQEIHPQEAGIHTVFSGRMVDQLRHREIRSRIHQSLNYLNPDAVAIAGWVSVDAIACLAWCRQHKKIAVLMSETRSADGRRIWPKEIFKSWRIKHYHGALVGGVSHAAYLHSLGFRGPVAQGYDVVDNNYFRDESERWRAKDQASGLTINPYFLASNRFVERKNLIRLVQVFAAEVRKPSSALRGTIDLCLLGDGPEGKTLRSTCAELNLPVIEAAPWEVNHNTSTLPLSSRVFLPGFRQIDELPHFYAHAYCFVHPAISEPWGLVINEAMAYGLPVLCSSNCGAAEELVFDGVNGFIFNPLDLSSIADAFHRFLALDDQSITSFGKASRSILENRCPLSSFGQGLSTLLQQLAQQR